MRKSVVVAVANATFDSLEQLFLMIAPNYNPNFMLSLLPKEFPELAPETLITRTAEFLKFIFLRSSLESSFVPVKKAIDEIWHVFIVQTMEYESFCQALPGKKFIHHTTMHLEEFSEKQMDRTAVIKDMLRWIPRYREYFGPFTEETAQYWMMPGFLQEAMRLSLNEINALK
jgi:hypothetical protein